MNNGKVKFFNENKGYGFITANESDFFFHINDVNGRVILKEDDAVSFDVKSDVKGDKAINISVVY